MAAGNKKRMEQTESEIKKSYGFKPKQGEPKMLDAEFCSDLPNEIYTSAWSKFKIVAGENSIKKWISDAGLVKCLKRDATCLLFVGEKGINDDFIKGKSKHYWLKPL